MYCPKCENEFSWDVMVCPTCDVDTVDNLPRPPGPEPTPDVELVPVLATGDAGLIAIAKSLLEAEKIDYLLRGDGLQDLFGAGRLTGYSFAMGPPNSWYGLRMPMRARALGRPDRRTGRG